MKKIYALFSLLCIACLLGGCTKDEATTTGDGERTTSDELYYANQFAYDALDAYYLWKDEIADDMQRLDPNVNEDPIGTVEEIRYKANGKEVDKWTIMTDDYASLSENLNGVSTTYGYSLMMGQFSNSGAYFFVVGFVYEGSPAEKAGLKRGDIIMQLNGENITDNNYQEALYSTDITLGMGELAEGNVIQLTGTTVALQAVKMYENPLLVCKTFDRGGKKIGYLAYSSFDLDSAEKLVEACRWFKQEGIDELVLDLRYNGGGYVFTENVLASMLAPEAVVNSKAVYQTEVWNPELMAYFRQNGTDTNTYFRTTFTLNNPAKQIDVSDANVGISKLYALVGPNSASASEAVLVCLMPYMDIELIGSQTYGKYCTGMVLTPENLYVKPSAVISNWGMYVMINRYADKDGNNPCMPDGLTPDIEAKDNPFDGYQLGDENEILLSIALARATGSNYGSEARSAALLPYHLKAVTTHPLFGKRIDSSLSGLRESRSLPARR